MAVHGGALILPSKENVGELYVLTKKYAGQQRFTAGLTSSILFTSLSGWFPLICWTEFGWNIPSHLIEQVHCSELEMQRATHNSRTNAFRYGESEACTDTWVVQPNGEMQACVGSTVHRLKPLPSPQKDTGAKFPYKKHGFQFAVNLKLQLKFTISICLHNPIRQSQAPPPHPHSSPRRRNPPKFSLSTPSASRRPSWAAALPHCLHALPKADLLTRSLTASFSEYRSEYREHGANIPLSLHQLPFWTYVLSKDDWEVGLQHDNASRPARLGSWWVWWHKAQLSRVDPNQPRLLSGSEGVAGLNLILFKLRSKPKDKPG